MDKLRKFFDRGNRDAASVDSDKLLRRASKPKSIPTAHIKPTHVNTEEFARAVVQEYGETLVLLGRE